LERSVLVQLIKSDGQLYVVEPSGLGSRWADNLSAAGRARLRYSNGGHTDVLARELPQGDERDRALDAQPVSQPRPLKIMYSRARRHIDQVGRVFRLEII
jgi:hypothetical protein